MGSDGQWWLMMANGGWWCLLVVNCLFNHNLHGWWCAWWLTAFLTITFMVANANEWWLTARCFMMILIGINGDKNGDKLLIGITCLPINGDKRCSSQWWLEKIDTGNGQQDGEPTTNRTIILTIHITLVKSVWNQSLQPLMIWFWVKCPYGRSHSINDQTSRALRM